MADKNAPRVNHDRVLALLALALAAAASVVMAGGEFELWGSMVGISMFCIIWGNAPRFKKCSFQSSAVSMVGGFSLVFVVGVFVSTRWVPDSVKDTQFFWDFIAWLINHMNWFGGNPKDEIYFLIWVAASFIYYFGQKWRFDKGPIEKRGPKVFHFGPRSLLRRR